MNVPSSPRFYAIVSSSSSVTPSRSPEPILFYNALSTTTTGATATAPTSPPPLFASGKSIPTSPAMMYVAAMAHQNHYTHQLSPIANPHVLEGAGAGSSSAGEGPTSKRGMEREALPNPRTVGQTPSPENNHWLNVGDRFIFLGGDNEDFEPYIVEATHRAALVPFEGKAIRKGERGENLWQQWFAYVEAARVFINPGKPWFRILANYESMTQARDLGVPKRKWMFLDGRDQPTRDCPTELGRRKANEFVQAVLQQFDGGWAEWEVEWEIMAGTSGGGRSTWNWKEDLKFGFIWPPDVGESSAGGHVGHGHGLGLPQRQVHFQGPIAVRTRS